MYENDNKAGIERNVKTGSGTAVIVAVIIGALLFIVPQLSFQKIENWIEGASQQETKTIRPDKTFRKPTRQIKRNLKVQTPQKKAIVREKVEKHVQATDISRRLPLLMAAVETDNLYLVKTLIKNGTNPNIQDVDGNEALAYVTDHTSPETIAYLLEQGLDINHRNKFQNTPLMFAIRYENVPAVRYMVEHGADVQATTRSGRTMVSMAKGPKVKAYLMSLDQPVEAPLTRVWWRQAGLNEVKRVFAQKPEIFQNRKIFALAAANTSDPRVIQFLIDKGFDVNRVDETGITPIFSAASSNGNPEILRYLVMKGADVNRTDETYGTTPLMAAAYFQRDPEIFKTLLSLGANPTLRDISGQTAVDYADRFNSREVISLLRKAVRSYERK